MLPTPIELDRVYCCDWRDLLSALPDDSADLILTDMPYGTTACSWDTVIDLDAWWVEAHRVAKPRAAIVCTGSQPFTSRLVMSNVKRFRYEWVWRKTKAADFLNANYRPMKIHENVMVFSDGAAAPGCLLPMIYNPQGLEARPIKRNRNGGLGIARDRESQQGAYTSKGTNYPTSDLLFAPPVNPLHPTQKPIPLFEYLIRTYTQPGDLVIDPFVGSGTTALAARNTGRRFICGDFTQDYVDIAQDRLRMPFEPRHVKQETRLDDLPLFKELAT